MHLKFDVCFLFFFSEMLQNTYNKEIINFLKNVYCKKSLTSRFARDSLTLISAILVRAKITHLTSCCIAFWDSVHPSPMPGSPGELTTTEKLTFGERCQKS